MLDFNKEILVIILDKGLLALIVLVLGYFYNKKLERFKTKFDYKIQIESTKIKELLNFASTTQLYGNSLCECYDLLLQYTVNDKDKKDNSLTKELILVEWDNLLKYRKQHIENLSRALPFIAKNNNFEKIVFSTYKLLNQYKYFVTFTKHLNGEDYNFKYSITSKNGKDFSDLEKYAFSKEKREEIYNIVAKLTKEINTIILDK